jgi:methionine-rich copper-binding protein CopC
VQGREEVGRPYAGNGIDTSANLVSVAESPEKITLRLSEEAQEGTLYIKAVDPMTDKVLDSIELTYKPFV